MDFEQAKEKAIRYVALCKKTSFEVSQKLARLSVAPQVIDRVVEYLTELGYIDDLDYIDSFIRQSVKMQKLSIFEIKQKLVSKGIDKDLINEKISRLYDTGYETSVVEKLLNGKLSDVDDVKAKNYIYRRGFRVNGRFEER